MQAWIVKQDLSGEFRTPERCFVLEAWRKPAEDQVSIARARVHPGECTRLHRLEGVDERYLMIEGTGHVEVGELRGDVGPGDIVIIPRGTPQRIENRGNTDLVFYCICTPPFTPSCYRDLESS